jgi:hypothetical protein
MIHILHLAEYAAIGTAAWLLFVWRRPFTKSGRRRIGGGWTARLHLTVHQMIDDWRAR